MERSRCAGFALVALLLAVAALEFGLLAAAPVAVTARRRADEAELRFRLRAYHRAFTRFRTQFGRYPAKLEELLTPPPNPRMLRTLYPDPMTPSGEWSIVRQVGGQTLTGVRSSSRERALDGSTYTDWRVDENGRFVTTPETRGTDSNALP